MTTTKTQTVMRRLGVLAAGLLLGAAGLAGPATASDHTNCNPADPQCEPPTAYPDELGTAADHAHPQATVGLNTAGDAITTARTRQGR